MKYSDMRNIKEEKNVAKVGDFIFAGDELRVIHKTCINGAVVYQAIFITSSGAFDGSGNMESSIEELLSCYKEVFSDFELIKADEMELVRR